MKLRKILLFVITITLLTSLLCLTVNASGEQFSGSLRISEDYQTATYNGKMYVTISSKYAYISARKSISEKDTELTDAQSNVIDSVDAYTSDIFLVINIDYKHGGYATYTYVDSAYYDQYDSFVKNGGDRYILFNDYNYNSKEVSIDALKGEERVIKGYELNYYMYESTLIVYTETENEYFNRDCGAVYEDENGDFYYLDYNQFGYGVSYLSDPSNYEAITIWKITDAKLVEDIEYVLELDGDDNGFNYGDYYGEDYESTMILLSRIVLGFCFGLLPLAALILFLILSFKVKDPYDKLFRVIGITMGVVLLLFITVFILLL